LISFKPNILCATTSHEWFEYVSS
jgi:hypothetical protein